MTHHDRAMEWAHRADRARAAGDAEHAQVCLAEAFRLERAAAEAFADALDYQPTRAVLYRSAATLARQAGLPDAARRLVAEGLRGACPPEIAAELREVME